jgi:osmoprotectant transport system permease protein
VEPDAEGDVTASLTVFGDALEFVVDERRLILHKTWEHLLLSGAAVAIALAIALPVGVWLGHRHRGSFLAVNVANLGRALPSLAVIAVGFVFIGVGFWSVAIALVVLAIPPILTNAYVAVDTVQTDAVEAARGMGMTDRQIITRVELPLALPLIFAGIRTATVFVVATATIAAVAGGGGLGDIIVNQAGYGLEGVVGAAICVSVLALVADGAVGLLQRALTPPGLRVESRSFEADVTTSGSRFRPSMSKVDGLPD